jgi:signal peptidase II
VVAVLGALAADQAVKRLLLSGAVGVNGTILIPGVANVRFTWNRGVSFSLLWQDTELGTLLLIVGAGCALAALLVWALRTHRAP